MTHSIEQRLAAIDWNAIEQSLSARGYAVTPKILSLEECSALVALYKEDLLG